MPGESGVEETLSRVRSASLRSLLRQREQEPLRETDAASNRETAVISKRRIRTPPRGRSMVGHCGAVIGSGQGRWRQRLAWEYFRALQERGVADIFQYLPLPPLSDSYSLSDGVVCLSVSACVFWSSASYSRF
jgi:hypothetical protein